MRPGADGTLTERPALGYRTATVHGPSPWGPPGTVVRGREFHYSTCVPPGDGLDLAARRSRTPGGFVTHTTVASYLHIHLATRPDVAEHFVTIASHTHV